MSQSESQEQDTDKTIKRSKLNYVHNGILLFTVCCAFALLFLHRSMPAILTAPMADYYNVDAASLTVFSAIFLWPYAVVQLFSGPLSDLIDPTILLSGTIALASVGSLISGFEKSIGIGILGRFLDGIGCGPIFVPISRILMNWFELKYYAFLLGVVSACGGLGGMIAQTPLQLFYEKYGWRWCFYGVAILGVIIDVLIVIFIRSTPSKFHYPNPTSARIPTKQSFKALFIAVFKNCWQVIRQLDFWMITIYTCLAVGPYYSVTGLWGGIYVGDIYPTFNLGNSLLSLSISMIISSVLLPMASDLIHTRKWMLIGLNILNLALNLVFVFVKPNLNFSELWAAFFFWSIATGGATNISLPLYGENFDPAIVSTALGVANFLAFIVSAVIQTISGDILQRYGKKVPGTTHYTPVSLRNAIWIPSTCFTVVSFIGVIFIQKDGRFEKSAIEKETESNSDIPIEQAPDEEVKTNDMTDAKQLESDSTEITAQRL